MKFTIATLALIGTQAVKISSERHHHRHQYGFSQSRSIPACNSFTFPKCVTEAETAAPKALQADQDKHDKDYFVPNFGVDHDIITTQSNLANAQKTLKHTWNIPAVAPSAAPAAAPIPRSPVCVHARPGMGLAHSLALGAVARRGEDEGLFPFPCSAPGHGRFAGPRRLPPGARAARTRGRGPGSNGSRQRRCGTRRWCRRHGRAHAGAAGTPSGKARRQA